MEQRSAGLAPFTFLRLQILFVAGLVVILVTGHPPSLRESAIVMPLSGGAGLTPSKIAPPLLERDETPYLIATHNVYLGPSKDYVVLGLLPRVAVSTLSAATRRAIGSLSPSLPCEAGYRPAPCPASKTCAP